MSKYKSRYSGQQIDNAVKQVNEGTIQGEVPAARKVGGITLENDTENLKSYKWEGNQTLEQKISAIENSVDSKQNKIDEQHKLSQSLVENLTNDLANKQDKIDEQHKLSQSLVDGLSDSLAAKQDTIDKEHKLDVDLVDGAVANDTEIGGLAINDGIEEVKDMIYEIKREEVELPYENNQTYNVKMSNINLEWPLEIPQEDEIYVEEEGVWLGWYLATFSETDYICLNYWLNTENPINVYYNPEWNCWKLGDGTVYSDPLTISFDASALIDETLFKAIVPPETEIVITNVTLEDAIGEGGGGGGITGPLKNHLYDHINKVITVVTDVVDGETYKFKKTYNGADFSDVTPGFIYGEPNDVPDGDMIILQSNLPIITYYPYAFWNAENMSFDHWYQYEQDGPSSFNWYFYTSDGLNVISDGGDDEPIISPKSGTLVRDGGAVLIGDDDLVPFPTSNSELFTDDISFIYDETRLVEGQFEVLQLLLDLTKQESIIADQTLGEKFDEVSTIDTVADRVVSNMKNGNVYRIKKFIDEDTLSEVMYRCNNNPYHIMGNVFNTWYVSNGTWLRCYGYNSGNSYVYNPELGGWCLSDDLSTLVDYDALIDDFQAPVDYDSELTKYHYFCPELAAMLCENLDGTPIEVCSQTTKTISLKDSIADWPISKATIATPQTGYMFRKEIDWAALQEAIPSMGQVYYDEDYPSLRISVQSYSGVASIYVECRIDGSHYTEFRYLYQPSGNYKIANVWYNGYYYNEVDDSGLYVDNYIPNFEAKSISTLNQEAFDLIIGPAQTYTALGSCLSTGTKEDTLLKDQTYGQVVEVVGSIYNASARSEIRPCFSVQQIPYGVVLDNGSLYCTTTLYESDSLLVQYFHTTRQIYHGGTYEDYGFGIVNGNTTLTYYIMQNNVIAKQWYLENPDNPSVEIYSQEDLPIINIDAYNEDWWGGTRYLPIAHMDEAPVYWNCYVFDDYVELAEEPAYWEYTYQDYYYYDDNNDEFVHFSGYPAPNFSDQPVYAASYVALSSKPADWENIYDNGDYYYGAWSTGGVLDIIGTLLCETHSSYVTLGEKLTIDKQSGFCYTTQLPEEPNLNGQIKIVLCSEEPEYKYDGYLYIITE